MTAEGACLTFFVAALRVRAFVVLADRGFSVVDEALVRRACMTRAELLAALGVVAVVALTNHIAVDRGVSIGARVRLAGH